ncbi:TIGR04283 family arsenosugar biosynthesis glycosyltransferase [Oculatella sp. LEGE 06141]|uniref:TIGR04283 family arsenosugar biosynthesis glycosyltransferase n=1 Tax=Oculatella sp. LEGE 06141 TaxID=1828648 RepID=UPI00187F66EC|nr:TIGR04283 family arsenosugar biosynthesis glycosyltransferase [Oculatella sp. LEGE 06141]MBE9177686.1 TIGR04283 family arsenosugar biosynthesis glycosyltransferase [Oculatella sp. LEGE 06141]
MTGVSIVIPTLNEASCLERTLRHLMLLNPSAAEIIIADGNSQDETVAIAHRLFQEFSPTTQTVLIQSEAQGRAIQMNRGARAATGDALCFLHADTLVPDDLVAIIHNTLATPKVVCGGFISLMAGATVTRWGVSFHNFLKTYYAPLLFHPVLFFKGLRLLFGDQVMFCQRDVFLECGCFNEALPIMEEADLCLRLVRYGKIRQVNRIVQSSDRRVAKWGTWKATAIYIYIGFLWGIGVSATYLKQFYDDIR